MPRGIYIRREETKQRLRAAYQRRKKRGESIGFIKGQKGFWKGKERLKEGKATHWKGDKAGYHAKHRWVESKLGKPNTCAKCKKGELKGAQIHWANRSGKYKRDLKDWIRLCAGCHGRFDKGNRKGLRNKLKII